MIGRNRLSRAFSTLLVIRGLSIGLVFLQTLILTRVFGVEVYGALTFALTIGAILMQVVSCGLDQVLLRTIARLGLDKIASSHEYRKVASSSVKVSMILSIVVLSAGACGLYFYGMDGIYSFPLTAVLISIPLMLVRKYSESVLVGVKKIVRSFLGTQIALPVTMIIGSVYLWWSEASLNVMAISVVFSLSVLLSLFVTLVLSRDTLGKIRPALGWAQLKETNIDKKTVSTGVNFALVSSGILLSQHIDILLVGILGSAQEVGIVRVCSRLAELTVIVRAILWVQYKPEIAKAHQKGQQGVLRKHARALVAIFTISGVPVFILGMIFPKEALGVFGAEFTHAYWVLRVYLVGVFFSLLCGPFALYLTMCEREGIAARIVWIAVVVNGVLDLILIPVYGSLGCAIANLTAMIVMGVTSVYYVYREIGVDTSIFALIRYRT